jgi:predicted transcriptional regulator
VTDAELAVLQVLWDRGACSRRQIAEVLYAAADPAQYATVQKLLQRLETKGYVVRATSDGGLTFRAVIDREQLISRRLLDVADKLCAGSVTPLLMNLVRAKPFSEAELRELEEFLAKLRRQARRKGQSA